VKFIWPAIVALSTLVAPIPAQTPVTTPAHIILIRHAEKPADSEDPHLSKTGVKRAQTLVSFITRDPQMTSLGRPVAVFATQTTKDENGQRTQETVAPLATALGLSVQTPYHGKDYADLAKLILSTAAYAGKTVVVCWNHEAIPELAAALGVTPLPPKWRGSVFDSVYVISYKKGKAVLTTLHY
jgi:phosphohistidine phosphatase SixA